MVLADATRTTLLTHWLGGTPHLWISVLVGATACGLGYLVSRYWIYGIIFPALLLIIISVPGARNNSSDWRSEQSGYAFEEIAVSYTFTGIFPIVSLMGGLKYIEGRRKKRNLQKPPDDLSGYG